MSDETPTRPDWRDRFDNKVLKQRLEKLDGLRENGPSPYATGFDVTHTAADLFATYGALAHEDLEATGQRVRVAGRIRFFRRQGKVAFVKIYDRTCQPGVKPQWEARDKTDEFLQLFISKNAVGEDLYEVVKSLDLGDVVGAEGTLMRTRTGELSVAVDGLTLLTKSVRPLPEKFHGLTDVEQRYRQRYVDLIMNEDSRQVFLTRSLIIRRIREYFDRQGYIEVETPMLQVQAGGATARPFVTHHNSLGIDMFLRVAPELYLKRLVVGGLERVYEINRNFRNEGLSRQHNPEFTMLEFYEAYSTWERLVEITEELVSSIAEELHGRDENGRITFTSAGNVIDVTPPWRQVRVAEALAEKVGVDEDQTRDRDWLLAQAKAAHLSDAEKMDDGKLLMELFEHHCEDDLIQPTFVTDFPASVSPLSRRKEDDPTRVDRFEIYVNGYELGNAFNELNDPEDQHARFVAQMEAKASGDEEAMPLDDDYVRALEYGMPPAAGEGIGIDRLVMLLTDSASIRDVILFPHMRPDGG